MTDPELMKSTRKALGLNQTEMAKRMGYANQEAISHIETGTRKMSEQVRQHLITIRKHEISNKKNTGTA